MTNRSIARATNSLGEVLALLVALTLGGCGARTPLGLSSVGTEASPGSTRPGPDGQCEGDRVLVPVDKVDLLFMIDNSASMADKQAILADAVPQLLDGLVNPGCVDAQGNVLPPVRPCPTGTTLAYPPVNDIHVAVISSSLGGHGADLCSDASSQWNGHQDDHAHLIPTLRPGLASYQNLGFLAYDPSDPSAIVDSDVLKQSFTREVAAVGEDGCGFESQLEAWYRFLIDPDPPIRVSVTGSLAIVEGPDFVVLDQRKAFMRADSLLAIVMISDENDCSIIDGKIGWIVGSSALGGRQFRMPAPTSTCATDPNSACCRSCGVAESKPPRGCRPVKDDAACSAGSAGLSASDDPLNLRCWDQKRRFGIDLLYPTSRYVDGLSSAKIEDRAGNEVANPIFSDLGHAGVLPRGRDMVFLAGIVGVPWQDIATEASLTDRGLRYLTADQLTQKNRWDVILGDVNTSVAPTDPYMLETNVPRSGSNPIVGFPLGSRASFNPQESPINGHEYTPSPVAGDLEYACIFPLAQPTTCTVDDASCDCVPDTDGGISAVTAANRPVCQPPGGGPPGTTQYWAKAYPGLRHLQVLKDFGSNSVVASICPKVIEPGYPDYGYNPAIWRIVDGLGDALVGRCVPKQ
jgi:hypothetical protein